MFSNREKQLFNLMQRPSISGKWRARILHNNYKSLKWLGGAVGDNLKRSLEAVESSPRGLSGMVAVVLLTGWTKEVFLGRERDVSLIMMRLWESFRLWREGFPGALRDSIKGIDVQTAIRELLWDPEGWEYCFAFMQESMGGFYNLDGLQAKLQHWYSECGEVSIGVVVEWGVWDYYGSPTYVLDPEFHVMLSTVPICGLEYVDIVLPYPVVELTLPPTLEPMANQIMDERFDLGGRIPVGMRHSVVVSRVSSEEGFVLNVRLFQSELLPATVGGAHLWVSVPDYLKTGVWEEGIRDRLSGSMHQNGSAIIKFVVGVLLYITHPDADTILGSESPVYRQWADGQARAHHHNKRRKKKKVTKRRQKRNKELEHIADGNSFYVGFRVIDRHQEQLSAEEKDGTDTPRRTMCPHTRRAHLRRCWMINPKDLKGPKIRVQRPVRASRIHAGPEYEISKVVTGLR